LSDYLRFHPDSERNPNFDPELCDKIVRFRARNDISQRELAKKLGVSLATVINVETGRRGPSKTTKVKILDLISDLEQEQEQEE